MALMTTRRIRHVPVVEEDGQLCGMISIGDMVKHRLDEIQGEADAMREDEYSTAGLATPSWSGAWLDRELPMTPTRLVVGFVAGFLAVLTFQSGLVAVFHAAGAIRFAPWRMTPVPPFGVPQGPWATFWGGLWGVAYALLEPRLTARLG